MKIAEPSVSSAPRPGVRAHDFGCDTPERLAARIAAQGFSCAQLALNKAIAGLNLQAGAAVAVRLRATFRPRRFVAGSKRKCRTAKRKIFDKPF